MLDRTLRLSKENYIDGIRNGDKIVLSRSISIFESDKESDKQLAREILEEILPYTGKSYRIGITGVPGVGKSTFINKIGEEILNSGHKLAILAVDPSSSSSKGSILGDKIRMSSLASKKNVFIRPSPTSNSLGGIAKKSREVMLLCEAAGYDVILVETTGVGQSEVAVNDMVDFFLLLLLAGAGDEVQGIKRGIMEIADFVLISKADGDNLEAAKNTTKVFEHALHFFSPKNTFHSTEVLECSSISGHNISKVWQSVKKSFTNKQLRKWMLNRRKNQLVQWMNDYLEETILEKFYQKPEMKKQIDLKKTQVFEGKKSPYLAAEELLDIIP